MMQLSHRLDLSAKAGELGRIEASPDRDHLQGHGPVERQVAGLVDDSQRPGPQDVEDLVAGAPRRPAMPCEDVRRLDRDRLPVLVAAQVLRQGESTDKAPLRLFLETLEADRLQVGRHFRPDLGGRRRFLR